METSPPAWGKRKSTRLSATCPRNIPTCVGKTGSIARLDRRFFRNIPTCVGKTTGARRACARPWKHPHLRGENEGDRRCVKSSRETSPPAWGKLCGFRRARLHPGNIPTCVGKTQADDATASRPQKHPHLRRENGDRTGGRRRIGETSPPAWGKLLRTSRPVAPRRNIPTCVGKTNTLTPSRLGKWKHPHLRGENISIELTSEKSSRNIPTCVGKTRPMSST